MKIKTILDFINYLSENSYFSETTIRNAIKALGFSLDGKESTLQKLSSQLVNCSEHGASCGIPGFIYYYETISFYKKNRKDIVSHMKQTAKVCGMDIISFIQNFGIYRNSEKPEVEDIGKALWGSFNSSDDFTDLFNTFSWYTLEEISNTWYGYLEDNPAVKEKMSA